MSKFPELTNDEIVDVLLYGGKPKGYGYSMQDFVDEWNDRISNGENLQSEILTKESNQIEI